MIPASLSKKNKWAIYRSHLVESDGSVYMKRWIFQTPRFGIRLHKICQSDSGRDLHDHPFDFTSVILRGGYVETRDRLAISGVARVRTKRRYGPGSVVRRSATDIHRLELDRPAWTLVFAGPYRRNWGFVTKNGWVDFENYHRSLYGNDWRDDRVSE